MSDLWKCPWCSEEMTEAHPMCEEAARDEWNHITVLEAERDAALVASRYETDVAQQALDEMKEVRAKRDALANKLLLAMEALRFYATPCNATEFTECGFKGNMCCQTAKQTLAQINPELNTTITTLENLND